MPESAAERNATSHTRRILQENVRREYKTHVETRGRRLPSELGIFVRKHWWRKTGEELANRNQFDSLISVSPADVPRMLVKH